MDQTDGVNRGKRTTKIDADERSFPRAEWSFLGQTLLERASAHEIGPESDPALVDVRAMHRDHIGMLDEREAASFVEKVTSTRPIARPGIPELEGYVTLKSRIEGTIHIAETARANPLDDLEGSPLEKKPFDGARGVELRFTERAMRFGDRFEQPKLL